jgi:hypothetical protein
VARAVESLGGVFGEDLEEFIVGEGQDAVALELEVVFDPFLRIVVPPFAV